ncbi:uncharacterized protein LOC127453849 [Myxocyprinus asiaticus]|uniref:uncharacterized protein LOC127453849 n=1 Tax=Myxocyprinus asiaticus TaxID=70543 RepID=UPI00222376AE|nr:uncharacterized protein LOC127453849 [Myxocyprinus asiaticus]
MADKCDKCLLGLIILCPLLTGINGVEETRVFCSFGEDVILPCNNALSDCNSTTWNYSRNRNSAAVELFAGGMKKYDIERHERLSLGSNCSLNIDKATEEDHGHYTCLQYVNKQKHGNDASVLLHVLHIFPSSTQNEIRPGNSVTLSCQLYSHDGVSCDILDHTEGIQLFWVNQAGVNLQTDSRYLISSSGHCNITLTTTLLNEDNNIEWRCQVNERNEVKTSASYTVKYLVIGVALCEKVHWVGKEERGNLGFQLKVIVIVVVIAALAVLLSALLWVICKKKKEQMNKQSRYTDADGLQMTQDAVLSDDKVTNASIRGAKAGPQEDCSELYASVNKTTRK